MIQASRTYYWLTSFALVVVLASCTRSGCGKEKPAQPGELGVAHPVLTKFPRLNFENLSSEQVASFTKILNDEICPCGCPRTFAQCMANERECKPGHLLAQWALDHLRTGAPERSVYQALSDEINNGYMSEPLTVNTAGAHHKGQQKAPITIIEFADFECPACKLASKSVSKLLKDYGDDIQLYFMHCPLSTHAHAEAAAVAAEAAGRQGKFWEMHDLLFAYERPLTDAAINAQAASLFNPKQLSQFEKDLSDPELLTKVRTQKDYAAKELKLARTPTFLFNGRPYNLSLAEDGFLLRVAMEKARDSIKCQAN